MGIWNGPNFDQTLKVTSWEQIPQSSWNLSRQHLSWRHLSISGISQLLLTRFWWNFKGSFLGQLEQISTIKLTFVEARFDLVSFVHIWNISAVTDSILTKKFSYFLFFRTRLFYQKLLYPKCAYDSQFLGGKNYVKIQYLVAEISSKTPVSFSWDTLYI